MRITPISINFTSNIQKQTKSLSIQPKTANTPVQNACFPNIFYESKEKKELKAIKTPSGSQRYSKKEIKEMNSLIKDKKLDVETVKYFSNTMLDPKSLSEVYAYGQNRKETKMAEYAYVHKNVENHEKQFKHFPDSIKFDGVWHTTFKYHPQKERPGFAKAIYTIEAADHTSGGEYSENGCVRNYWTMSNKNPTKTGGSPDLDSSSSSYESSKSSSTYGDVFDPLNPLSPWHY